MTRPRLLIEDWLPAAAIGVECMRERGSASALAPTTYLHVWWARRPLTAARAAVLGSLLPADFPRDTFERLLGFGHSGKELVEIRSLMDTGYRVEGGFGCDRAFKARIRPQDLEKVHEAAQRLWKRDIVVMDPMAGGGSIPLESARLGFTTLANEYNPVACTVLEATVDYPLRHGDKLATKTRKWAKVWSERAEEKLARFYPVYRFAKVHAYIFARTVPCPDTQHETPLVPDWHLFKPKNGTSLVAEPVADKVKGTWSIRVREIGGRAGQLREVPKATYKDGKGISLFSGQQIPSDYIKTKAQQGQMGNALYAVAVKTPQGFTFQPPGPADLKALEDAERELSRLRPGWEKANVIPTEKVVKGQDDRAFIYGMETSASRFSPRQLLCFGVLVEELKSLRPEILKVEGKETGEAVIHLLALVVDKFANHNAQLASWDATTQGIRSVFDKHSYGFKPAFAEMAPCNSGSGLDWAIDNVLEAYEGVANLPHHENAQPVDIFLGSATALPQIADESITAVIVDPPYADNVQYSELADFFYVWLKRTQGHRRPEWFATYLCENDQEAVVNITRHRENGARPSKAGMRDGKAKDAKVRANSFYQKLMGEVFAECRRILCDDGVLTVMFTHKKQEAWEALFQSLIEAGFTITATWPVKTESEHSLHQAKKNAAQSTVILVARKRDKGKGLGYFTEAMKEEIREKARATAQRLQSEGLNPVDQLVGAFGPAMEVYSQFDSVNTDTGQPVGVGQAIDEASSAVSAWRVQQLAQRGLEGVEAEGKFYLLCWDVLRAGEFRFNEAHLLGKAVGMDVATLEAAGLVIKSGDKVQILPAKDRRRDQPLEADEVSETLFGQVTKPKRGSKKLALKVHPNDGRFRTALDACHALALRYLEAGSGTGGIGSAKALARQQGWAAGSPVARLMQALVQAAPEALHHEKGKTSAAARFPEFRAWHALMEPLFGVAPPDWTEKPPASLGLFARVAEQEDSDLEDDEAGDSEGSEEGEE
ncbi:MAG: DUF1156 domain-containing protein [Acidobacteriota bacterium]